MNNITIELTPEQIDEIVAEALKETQSRWIDELITRKDNNKYHGVFDNDRDTDIKKLRKAIKAAEKLIDWYTVQSP